MGRKSVAKTQTKMHLSQNATNENVQNIMRMFTFIIIIKLFVFKLFT